jgi:hypothetical protein
LHGFVLDLLNGIQSIRRLDTGDHHGMLGDRRC